LARYPDGPRRRRLGRAIPGQARVARRRLGRHAAGGSGNDELYGGAGNDVLEGRKGNDTANAGLATTRSPETTATIRSSEVLRADDDEADTNLNGGPGSDTAHYDQGIDVALVAVETLIPA
jgi:hypothetical protein